MPFGTVTTILVLALLSGLTTVAGTAMAIWLGKDIRAITIGIGFSAGLMLLISIHELIPQSLRATGGLQAWIAVATGAALVGLLHVVIPHTHLVEERGAIKTQGLTTAYLVTFGLVLHDLPEGFAMANSYLASPSLGLFVALAIALHNVPEEFVVAVAAVATKKKRLLFGAALVSGLAEPVGALLGLLAVHTAPAFNAFFIGLAAGAMIVVSLNELLPLARQYGKMRLFALGFALSAIVYSVLAFVIHEP
jgi:ZIP family zinc transporter